jgi:hypothetical protein
VRTWRNAVIPDIQALFDQVSQFIYSQGSNAFDSRHRHSTRWAMVMHDFKKPVRLSIAERIAATARNGVRGHIRSLMTCPRMGTFGSLQPTLASDRHA